MANSQGHLERVTGDIDVVAITKANGQVLSPQERLDIYQNLQDVIDIQHGDTLSWLNSDGGELVGTYKAQLLADHAPGGEPLAVFDPTASVRANFIQPQYTFFNAADKQGRIWHVGGYRTPAATAYHFGQLAYPMFLDAYQAASPWLTRPAGYTRSSKPLPLPGPAGHGRAGGATGGNQSGRYSYPHAPADGCLLVAVQQRPRGEAWPTSTGTVASRCGGPRAGPNWTSGRAGVPRPSQPHERPSPPNECSIWPPSLRCRPQPTWDRRRWP